LPATRRAPAYYLEHQSLIHFFLRALGNEVKPFCSPSATEMVDGEPVTAALFDRCLATVKAVIGEALGLGTGLAVAVTTGGPPSGELAQEAPVCRHDGGGWLGNGS
jgi:hypothetical protein